MSNESEEIIKKDLFAVFSKKDWTAGSWFRFLSIFLIVWIALYLLIHMFDLGHEYVKLSPNQLKNVVWLIDDSANAAAKNKVDELSATDSTQTATDTAKNATVAQPKCVSCDTTLKCRLTDTCGFSKAAVYIQGEFDGRIDCEQMQRMMCYLCNASSKEVTLFLTDTKFKIASYFWLTGGWAYIEVIFWVIIGVICSLLYYVGDKNRNATTLPDDPKSAFDPTEVPYQIAKFFYAPCCTLVIILGYSFLQGENLVDINASKGIIVFSFIAGFYSGRMMSFLDRLKDLLLPLGTDTKNTQPQKQKAEDKPAAATATIQIELIAADPGLTEEQKNHLTETGMGSAEVTLQAEGSTDKITAEKTGEEQQSLFQVTNIAAGKYTIEAKYAGSFDENDIINLEATLNTDISSDTKDIKLNMLKSESDG